MLEISKNEKFYQQEYCDCVYSLRDTNRWRMSHGRDRIKLGVKFYSNAMDEEAWVLHFIICIDIKLMLLSPEEFILFRAYFYLRFNLFQFFNQSWIDWSIDIHFGFINAIGNIKFIYVVARTINRVKTSSFFKDLFVGS